MIHASGRVKVVIHIVSEHRFGSLALCLYLHVLHLVVLETILFIGIHNVIELLSFFLDVVNLASISLEYALVTVSNVLLKLGSLVIEFVPAAIFDPFPSLVHGIDHVDLLGLESIHLFNEGLLSSEILDSFVGSLLFGLQLKNSRLEKLLLCEHLFLFVNRLHHVSLGLAANHRETRLHKFVLITITHGAPWRKHVASSRLVEGIHFWGVHHGSLIESRHLLSL